MSLLNLAQVRSQFGVTGKGLRVAAIDTGVRPTHEAFIDRSGAPPRLRVIKERNFTTENGGWSDDAWSTHGHGTHVTGIIAGQSTGSLTFEGIAPQADIVAIKVLDRNGSGDLKWVAAALDWIARRPDLGISAVNLSLGDGGNYTQPDDILVRMHVYRKLANAIRRLQGQNVAVVCAAGNGFYLFSQAGLSFPAILDRCNRSWSGV